MCKTKGTRGRNRYKAMRYTSMILIGLVCMLLATGCGKSIYKPDYERGYLKGKATADELWKEFNEYKDVYWKLKAINQYRSEVRRVTAAVANDEAYSFDLGRLRGLQTRPVK